MKNFANKKFKIILAVIICIALGMLFAGASSKATSPLTRVISVVFTPLEELAEKISDGTKNLVLSFRSADYYKKQNEELQSRIDELEKQAVDYENIKQELNSYKEAFGVLDENPSYKTVYAKIIARDAADLYNSFTLNKGSLDGIEVSNAVIYGDANLVGIVSEVSLNSCVVASVTDPGVSLGVYEIRSREDGYLRNDTQSAFTGLAKLTGLSKDTAINEGGIVCTSGAGGTVPGDLIVGTVRSVFSSDADVSVYATVEPAADITTIKNVFVITDF